MKHLGVVLVLLATTFASRTAEAQRSVLWNAEDALHPRTFAFAGALGFGGVSYDDDFPGDPSSFVSVFDLGGRGMLAPNFALAMDWSFANGSFSAGNNSDSAFVVGNPFISGHLVLDLGISLLDVGFGVAAPLASANDGLEASAYILAMGQRGLWDVWLWSPDTFTAAAPVRLLVDLLVLKLAVEGTLALMVPTDNTDNRDPELMAQVGAQAAVAFTMVDVGVRGQLAALLTDDGLISNDDAAQVALGPFLRVNLGGGFLGAEFLINVDPPFGTSFEDVDGDSFPMWSFTLGGGAHL